MMESEGKVDAKQRIRWLMTVWGVVTIIACGLEINRLSLVLGKASGLAAWLVYWDMESTLPCLCLLSLPVIVAVMRNRGPRSESHRPAPAGENVRSSWLILACLTLFAVSLCCSWRVGSRTATASIGLQQVEMRFADLPPAYHDEYSYLLQARTFLNGRLSWPAMTIRPDLFHQFHVLNERRTVSRYFPWTGCWMAPFEATGNPIVGHWIAGGLSAVFFFLAFVQIVSPPRAFIGGLLIAVSPGLAIFSNLLLSHHPTMLALSIFLASFVRMSLTGQKRWAYMSGVALTLAMLGRPMTAAGFALPFGVWLIATVCRRRIPLSVVAGFAVPIIGGFVVLAILNHDATGDWTRTAYQEYTERYTPRHRYGFNNALDPPAEYGPQAVREYDRWATNLTPSKAIANLSNRVVASFQWSLAILPLLFCVLMCLPSLFRRTGSLPDLMSTSHSAVDHDMVKRAMLRLSGLSILTLHAAHLPYWFDGIMHWHYVFETAPLLLLLAGVGAVNTVRELSGLISSRQAAGWMLVFVVSGLLPGWFELSVFDRVSKTGAAVSELSYSRLRFEHFNRIVSSRQIRRPALILVNEQGTDPQLSYIINPPQLDSEVLVCRMPDSAAEVEELRASFPDRNPYVFDPGTMGFSVYVSPTEDE